MILFNATLRIYIFRALLISSVATLASLVTSVAVQDVDPQSLLWLLFIIGLLLHHVVAFRDRALNWRLMLTIFDFILLSAEISVLLVLANSQLVLSIWSTSNVVLLVCCSYFLIMILIMSWIFRVSSLLASRGRRLLKPFDILSGCRTNDTTRSLKSLLFGRSSLTSSFRGEKNTIRISRAVLAISFLLGILLFAAISIVVEPIHEAGFTPTKSYRTSQIINLERLQDTVWSIVAFIDMRIPAASNVDILKASLNVTPLWDDSLPEKPDCVALPGVKIIGGTAFDSQYSPHIQVITINCPSRIPVDVINSPSSITTPDLLITVNFTTLGISPVSLVDSRMSSVSVMMGLTKNIEDVLANTIPMNLFPGSHLCGGVRRRLRRQFRIPSLASFGIITSSRTFFISDFGPVFPDPSPLIEHLPNTATLRVYGINDVSDWDILQDYRDNSVWSGFSSVGGLWTFLNGVFALIFGSSLLLILFGIKPLSIFGLAHMYRREELRQAWQGEYPLLAQERRMPNSERGLLAFLRNHLVNLNFLDDYEEQADDNHDCEGQTDDSHDKGIGSPDHSDTSIPLFNRGK